MFIVVPVIPKPQKKGCESKGSMNEYPSNFGSSRPDAAQLSVRTMPKGCKFRMRGEECPHGCTGLVLVCHHFARGDCWFGRSCRLLHDQDNPEQEPSRSKCRHLARGQVCPYGCTAGLNNCHAFVRDGVCQYGNMCRRFHPVRDPSYTQHERGQHAEQNGNNGSGTANTQPEWRQRAEQNGNGSRTTNTQQPEWGQRAKQNRRQRAKRNRNGSGYGSGYVFTEPEFTEWEQRQRADQNRNGSGTANTQPEREQRARQNQNGSGTANTQPEREQGAGQNGNGSNTDTKVSPAGSRMLNALRDLDMNTNSSFSLRDVTIAYRAAAVRHHPDKGGQVSVFRQVKAAYDFLRGLFRCD